MRTLPIVAGLFAWGLSLQASAYSIDANLVDWGLTRTGSVADWMPNASVKA